MNDQHYRINQLVHRAYQKAKARHDIREMGHPLPDPTDPDSVWRTRFEDTIFRLISRADNDLTGQGQEGSGPDGALSAQHSTVPSLLSVLPGGVEDTRRAGGVAAGLRSSQLRHGDRPPRIPGVESGGHPSNFETEETI